MQFMEIKFAQAAKPEFQSSPSCNHIDANNQFNIICSVNKFHTTNSSQIRGITKNLIPS